MINFKHGSEAIQCGKLRGATDTDYFYFFCPKCEGNQIMRLLDYRIYEERRRSPYDDCEGINSKSANGFTLQFKIHCEKCKHSDTVKLTNINGWPKGDHSEALKKLGGLD